jgi:hypothetical protein
MKWFACAWYVCRTLLHSCELGNPHSSSLAHTDSVTDSMPLLRNDAGVGLVKQIGIPDKLLDNSELWDEAHAIVLTYSPYERESLSKVRNDYAPLLEYFAAGLPVLLVSFIASEDEVQHVCVCVCI